MNNSSSSEPKKGTVTKAVDKMLATFSPEKALEKALATLARLENAIGEEADRAVRESYLPKSTDDKYRAELGLPPRKQVYEYTAALPVSAVMKWEVEAATEEEARELIAKKLARAIQRSSTMGRSDMSYPDLAGELTIDKATITSNRPADKPETQAERPALYSDDASTADRLLAVTARIEWLKENTTRVMTELTSSGVLCVDGTRSAAQRIGVEGPKRKESFRVEMPATGTFYTTVSAYDEADAVKEAVEKAKRFAGESGNVRSLHFDEDVAAKVTVAPRGY